MTALPSQRACQAMLFIQRYMARIGRAPTLQEIGDGIGVASKSSAHRVVTELECAGFIARGGAHRSIQVLRLLPDDRFEAAAIAVCQALGADSPADVAKARAALIEALMIERSAA